MLRTSATALAALLIAGLSLARANPASIVPSAGDSDHPVSIHVGVDYEYELDRSVITRESLDPGNDPLDAPSRHKDLLFHQYRHVLTPHMELGVAPDVWISAALPVTLAQARELRLASGVTRADSSTLVDGLLPPDGFDAHDPGTPPAGDMVFRGRDRRGLDQVYVGLSVAPMNQRRDDTKPTWKLGGELRLAVGKVMRFDAMDPAVNTAVGRGVHELRLWTTIDRQYRHAESWVKLFWQTPIATRTASLFQDPGFGATNVSLGQQAGAEFGIEAYAVNDVANGNRISFDLGSRIVGHFEGRDYSELWEVFSYAGDSRLDGPLILDRDPTDPGVQRMSHPGISNVESYLETGAKFALRGELGPKVRFAATVDVIWKTDHAISFADAGQDLPTCPTGASPATSRCELDENDRVNPGTAEVNPVHAPLIDLVGHRYFSEHNLGVVVGIQGLVLF